MLVLVVQITVRASLVCAGHRGDHVLHQHLTELAGLLPLDGQLLASQELVDVQVGADAGQRPNEPTWVFKEPIVSALDMGLGSAPTRSALDRWPLFY